MSIKDEQKGVLSNRFNTAVTSSLGLTANQDKLINAASAVGDNIGFIGRADHFGYGDQLRKLRLDVQKKKDKALREITRMSLSQVIQFAQDTIDGFSEEAKEWRKKQEDTLDLIIEFKKALSGAQDAHDNDDLARDEHGKFVNEDAQTATEGVLATEGKTAHDMQDMSDEEAKVRLDYGLEHSNEIAKSLSEKSECEGTVADKLEQAADKLKEALFEIRTDSSLTDEEKKEAIYQKTIDATDGVVRKLKDMGVEDQMIKDIVQDVQKDNKQSASVNNEAGTFLSDLGL